MSNRLGPSFSIIVKCAFCEYLESEYYCTGDDDSDWGFNYHCKRHNNAPIHYTGECVFVRIGKTSVLCDLYNDNLIAFIKELESKITYSKK